MTRRWLVRVAWLVAIYLAIAAYLPISRWLPPGRSFATSLDALLPLAPLLGPVYVFGMVPIALLPLVFYGRLTLADFRRYAAGTIAGALATYALYFLWPSEIRRPPLPEDPVSRACLALAYSVRSPRGVFPSAHTLYTALNATFLWAFVPAGWRWGVAAGSGLVVASALLTGLHFAADVAAGLALAAVAMWSSRRVQLAGGKE